jgi:hypothetical protein
VLIGHHGGREVGTDVDLARRVRDGQRQADRDTTVPSAAGASGAAGLVSARDAPDLPVAGVRRGDGDMDQDEQSPRWERSRPRTRRRIPHYLTVIVTGADLVALPATSVATAVSVRVPCTFGRTAHVTEYGAVVSVPMAVEPS